MLCLARNVNQRVLIRTSDGDVWVTVMARGGGKVMLGVDAPEAVKVYREELWLQMQQDEEQEEGSPDVSPADDANPGGHD